MDSPRWACFLDLPEDDRLAVGCKLRLRALTPPIHVLDDEDAAPLRVPRHKRHGTIFRYDECGALVICADKTCRRLMPHSAQAFEFAIVHHLSFRARQDPSNARRRRL